MSKAVRRTATLQVIALFCRKFLVWLGPAEPEGTGNLPFLPHTPTQLPGERRALSHSALGLNSRKTNRWPIQLHTVPLPLSLWYKGTWQDIIANLGCESCLWSS